MKVRIFMLKVLQLIKVIDKIFHLVLGDRTQSSVDELNQCLKESNRLLSQLREIEKKQKGKENEYQSCSE